MIRPRNLILVVLTLTLGLPACQTGNNATPSVAPATTKIATAVEPGFNLLFVVKGEVQLKRNGWKDYHPTAFGTVLHRGDLLRPASSAKVVVLCDNLTIWDVPAGIPSGLTNGCPQPPEPALVSGKSLLGNTRGNIDPLIPYIINPRTTKLLGSTPVLRWNSVPRAKSYIVRVEGEGLEWTTTISNTEIIYPGDPLLQPGVIYMLMVEADTGNSSRDEGTPGLGFSLLSEEEANRVRVAVGKLSTLKLPAEAQAFGLAQLYTGHGLNAEAIETLEQLVVNGNQAANVYRAIGDLYRQTGLNMLAENYYTKAIELSQAAVDVEGLAAAQAGLGTVYETLGNKSEAIRWFEQAKLGYETLGDKTSINELGEKLENLDP